jgi:hypothetical protein
MSAVEERISDRRLLSLLRAFLRAGVMEQGTVRRPVTGTAQGGVISPLMCNVYLHGDRLQGCHRARRTPMQPAQLSLIPDPGPASSTEPVLAPPPAQTVDRLPADAASMAITLLANVIAKAAAAMGSGVVGDE